MAMSWVCPICGYSNTFLDKTCSKCNQNKLNDTETQRVNAWKDEVKRFLEDYERFQASSVPKWNYLQLNSEELEKIPGGLEGLGLAGWELVNLATYETGSSGRYTVHSLYVFKRPYLKPDWYDARLEDIKYKIPKNYQRYLLPKALRKKETPSPTDAEG